MQTVPLGLDLGSPVDLAWGPLGGPFEGTLYVLDNGSRHENGILENRTGRVLAIDVDTGSSSVFLQGLDAPVGMLFGDGSFFGEVADHLYVLSAGTVDPLTGFLVSATGKLSAYDVSGNEVTMVEQLDSPYDIEFRTETALTVATTTRILEVGGFSAIPTGGGGCNAPAGRAGVSMAEACWATGAE